MLPDKDFIHEEGLATNERIATKKIIPTKIIEIKDVVKELKKLGVTFHYINSNNKKNSSIKRSKIKKSKTKSKKSKTKIKKSKKSKTKRK